MSTKQNVKKNVRKKKEKRASGERQASVEEFDVKPDDEAHS